MPKTVGLRLEDDDLSRLEKVRPFVEQESKVPLDRLTTTELVRAVFRLGLKDLEAEMSAAKSRKR